MPYASKAQSAYIHSQAAKKVPWAMKFVRDSQGTTVPNVNHVTDKLTPGDKPDLYNSLKPRKKKRRKRRHH